MSRNSLVHDKMVDMWARRFLSIGDTYGHARAVAWGNVFLNPDDSKRVIESIKSIREPQK